MMDIREIHKNIRGIAGDKAGIFFALNAYYFSMVSFWLSRDRNNDNLAILTDNYVWPSVICFAIILAFDTYSTVDKKLGSNRVLAGFLFAVLIAIASLYAEAWGRNILAINVDGPFQHLTISVQYSQYLMTSLLAFMLISVSNTVAMAMIQLRLGIIFSTNRIRYLALQKKVHRFRLIRLWFGISYRSNPKEEVRTFWLVTRLIALGTVFMITHFVAPLGSHGIINLMGKHLVDFAYGNELIADHECPSANGFPIVPIADGTILVGEVMPNGKLLLRKSNCSRS